MKGILTLCTYLFIQILIIAQPNTDIYVMDLRRSSEGLLIEKPTNISNNEGYDNQPAFWIDSESLLYARTVEGQTEIARYYFDSGNTLILTDTKQGGEYSPTPMPDGRISSVRLDTTGLQLLYAYTFSGDYEVLVPELVIGYHAWVNENQIVAFVLGDEITMQLINTKSNRSEIIGTNIGRSLHRIPGKNAFSFVDKNESPWMIKVWDVNTKKSQPIKEVIEGNEDYCWTPNGEILMANGAELHVWDGNSNWKKFADLSKLGISKITRVTVSPDGKKIAVAGE